MGYEIYLPDSRGASDLYEACSRRASRSGSADRAAEARRIEAGIFNYGSDMRVEDTPLHVTRAREVRRVGPGAGLPRQGRLAADPRRQLLDRKLVGIEIGGEPMTDEGALNDSGRCPRADAERSDA